MSCIVYVACKMTGRDKLEMIQRAKSVCNTLRQYGLTPISPVIEEHVEATPGPLVNDSIERLRGFWKRDKEIIRREANVVILDGADSKSFGMEREYALSRFCLWKPTIIIVPRHELTVADFEDDVVTVSEDIAGAYIRAMYGTRWKRWKWRFKMLNRTFPNWLLDQIYAWR